MSVKKQTNEQRFWQRVADARHIVIAAHEQPDGDAIGSTLALYHICKKLKKSVMMCNPGPKPQVFDFLPSFDRIIFDDDVQAARQLKLEGDSLASAPDTLIVGLDYGSWDRTGLGMMPDKQIVSVDHHPDRGAHRGDLQIIDTNSSSVCEMLYYFMQDRNALKSAGLRDLTIDRDIATCMMTGIITDTGGFRHSNTSKQTLIASEELMLKGAPLHQLMKLFTSIPKEAMAIWEWAMDETKIEPTKGFAYCYIPRSKLDEFGVDREALGGLSNMMATIPEAKFALLMKDGDSATIKGSLRSTTEQNYDCASLAQKLGGGGHRLAAGFEQPGTAQEVLEKVIDLA